VTNPAPGKPQTARVSDELAAIWVEPIPNRVGQLMRNALIDKINGTNEPTHARYSLEVRLQELKQALLERRDTLETATNLILIATFRLKTPDGTALTTNKSRTVVLYNQLTSPYATIAAEDFARERAVRSTAEDIRLRISLYIANRLGT
jgi:LPS-assembly lipoprotein